MKKLSCSWISPLSAQRGSKYLTRHLSRRLRNKNKIKTSFILALHTSIIKTSSQMKKRGFLSEPQQRLPTPLLQRSATSDSLVFSFLCFFFVTQPSFFLGRCLAEATLLTFVFFCVFSEVFDPHLCFPGCFSSLSRFPRGFVKPAIVLPPVARPWLTEGRVFCLPEKDEQQHCAEAWYPRMHLASDTADNQVPGADPEIAAAH